MEQLTCWGKPAANQTSNIGFLVLLSSVIMAENTQGQSEGRQLKAQWQKNEKWVKQNTKTPSIFYSYFSPVIQFFMPLSLILNLKMWGGGDDDDWNPSVPVLVS